MKKRVFKTIVIILLLCFITIPLLIKVINRNTRLKWPEGNMAALIPRPNSRYGSIEINDEKELLMDIYKVSETDFKKYIWDCEKNSFDLYEVLQKDHFSAYDWNGNVIEIDYDKKHKKMCLHAYESKEVSILKGIEYYELNYYAYYNYDANTKDYYADYYDVTEKYVVPQKTTIYELKKDFPFEESCHIVTKKLRSQRIELDDETEIWVYASYKDNCAYHEYKYTYDLLNITKDQLEIKTHFEDLYDFYPKPDGNGIVPDAGMSDYRIIVVTIIPIEQSRAPID